MSCSEGDSTRVPQHISWRTTRDMRFAHDSLRDSPLACCSSDCNNEPLVTPFFIQVDRTLLMTRPFSFSSFNICALYEYLLRLYLFYIMNVGSYVSSYIGTLRRSVLSQCFGRDFKYLLVCVDELTRSPIASVQIFSEVRQRALKSRAVRVDQMQWENVAPCISTH